MAGNNYKIFNQLMEHLITNSSIKID